MRMKNLNKIRVSNYPYKINKKYLLLLKEL